MEQTPLFSDATNRAQEALQRGDEASLLLYLHHMVYSVAPRQFPRKVISSRVATYDAYRRVAPEGVSSLLPRTWDIFLLIIPGSCICT